MSQKTGQCVILAAILNLLLVIWEFLLIWAFPKNRGLVIQPPNIYNSASFLCFSYKENSELAWWMYFWRLFWIFAYWSILMEINWFKWFISNFRSFGHFKIKNWLGSSSYLIWRGKVSIVGSLRDQEEACSTSDRQGSNFESCVWRTVSSQSSHHPQEVLLAQFSLYVHKGGLKPDSFHFLFD